MNRMTPAVDFYFSKNKKWPEELEQLRTFVLDCGLTEELKWGVPGYTFQGRNIGLLHVFKECCAFLFFKGALLKDAQGMLTQQTENTQAQRQMRFATVGAVMEREAVLKAYIQEAIEVQKAGLKVPLKKSEEYAVPEAFQQKLAELPALKTALAALTPGWQRAYLLYFAGAKQAKTRAARVEKCTPRILVGKGLED